MAISEIPSLHFKPVAYKTNKLYLKLPEGSIGNMVFARTSIATRVNKDGLIEEMATGIPRLDYPLINGVVQSCPDSLLEPTRTNLCLRSEQINSSEAEWSKSAGGSSTITITNNTTVAPDGNKTAERVVYHDEGDDGFITQNITLSNTTDYELSVWMKGQVGGEKVTIRIKTQTGQEFTLTTNWVRYTLNETTSGTDRGFQFTILKGHRIDQTFYVWGSQLELSDYGTSYIKTEGSSVTRAKEESNSGGDSTTFEISQGVLYAEISALFDTLSSRIISISDNSYVNYVSLAYSTNTNQVRVQLTSGSSSQRQLNHTVSDETETIKVAIKWDGTNLYLYVNGVQEAFGSIGANPLSLTVFDFNDGGGFNDFYGRVKEVMVYKTALTDAELEELTT